MPSIPVEYLQRNPQRSSNFLLHSSSLQLPRVALSTEQRIGHRRRCRRRRTCRTIPGRTTWGALGTHIRQTEAMVMARCCWIGLG